MHKNCAESTKCSFRTLTEKDKVDIQIKIKTRNLNLMKKKQRGVQVLLRKEFLDVKKKPRSEFFQVYDLYKDDIQKWEIYVFGPPETPYEGGTYKALMEFPDDYPMKPPKVQFLSRMFHPNIYKDGKVCISTLQTGKPGDDSGVYWRPVLGVEQAILSVVSLLSDPNLADPANTEAANVYHLDREKFNKKCKELAEKSLKLVPEDLVKPVVEHSVPEKVEKAEEREGLRPDLEFGDNKDVVFENEGTGGNESVEGEDEGFEYDIEDLSSDEGYSFSEKKRSLLSRSLKFVSKLSRTFRRKKKKSTSSFIFDDASI